MRKCPYCDFNSHAIKEDIPEQRYVQALLADLDQDMAFVAGRPIETIFMGGGTPSLFSGEAMSLLFKGLRERLTFASDIEITLEANPGTVESRYFDEYRAVGINRLSLGVQSFDETALKTLGRIHSADEAVKAVGIARKAGFENINLDLMHGLPNQTVDAALQDIDMALSLSPTHLSWYELTLEPNTYFYKHPPEVPPHDALWDIQVAGQDRLAAAGFLQYEVSAYKQLGRECRHNVNYWQFGDYLGIGAGAHSKLTQDNKIHRLVKAKHPKHYLDPAKPFVVEQRSLEKQALPFEFMLNALRLHQPVTKVLFESRTGQSFDSLQPVLVAAAEKGLIHYDKAGLETTVLGKRFLDELVGRFLPQ